MTDDNTRYATWKIEQESPISFRLYENTGQGYVTVGKNIGSIESTKELLASIVTARRNAKMYADSALYFDGEGNML